MKRLLAAALLSCAATPALAGFGGPIHVVRQGETLYRIAKMHNVDLTELAARNGLPDPARVPLGLVLRLPAKLPQANIPPLRGLSNEIEPFSDKAILLAFGAPEPLSPGRIPTITLPVVTLAKAEPAVMPRHLSKLILSRPVAPQPVGPLAAVMPVIRSEEPRPEAPKPVQLAANTPALKPDELQPVGETELSDMRAGYFLANGAQFDFGATIQTTVNGEVALHTTLQWTAEGAIVNQVVGANATSIHVPTSEMVKALNNINAAIAMNGAVVKGPSGTTQVVANLTAGHIQNILINTASNQTIVQDTAVQLTIYNFNDWQQQIGRNMVASRLANDIRAAAVQMAR